QRDSRLPKYRQQLLENARKDVEQDPVVIAVYRAGSLAKGNADDYSDIDLHTIVKPDKLADFIAGKKERAKRWGTVLFFEGSDSSPVIVSHFDCFVKVDSWYHAAGEISPSIWLKGMKILFDPEGILAGIKEGAENSSYEL